MPRPGRVRLLKKRIISNNSYANDDQGDNPGQETRGLDGVLYKLWPLVSDIAIFVLKRDVKLLTSVSLTTLTLNDGLSCSSTLDSGTVLPSCITQQQKLYISLCIQVLSTNDQRKPITNNGALGLNGSLVTKQTTKYITDQVLKASWHHTAWTFYCILKSVTFSSGDHECRRITMTQELNLTR